MKLEDALFNWLQIDRVASARPDDRAALQTRDFFLTVLQEDHGVSCVSVSAEDATMVHVRVEFEKGSRKLFMFDRQASEQLLADIASNPRYQ
ncbi:hypothetical protein [Paenibacillus xylaniclasticus]|uniref:hypothetical protein n=1 Tax=Paenibacillus xylaniclasticus TaxID=588083 RepID=UPI000FD87F1A|nr:MULTISPECIES: hypothetical protein [Paenibacillus]GFN30371.1 hypothetical protein PCURB6_06310 [Paenibacillus curdlanolyticus]